VCLGKLDIVEDALVIGQKIVSCVLRLREQCAIGYISKVLTGSREQRILTAGHEQLSTWNILGGFRRQDVRQWIEQLLNQRFLCLVDQEFFNKPGKYQVVRVTEAGRRLLAGEATPVLTKPPIEISVQTPTSVLDSWEGVDRGLFDALGQLRREEALLRGVPSYIVFSDASLRDMARRRPSTVERFLEVHGVGQKKSADFGEQFVSCITTYCRQHGIGIDVPPEPAEVTSRQTPLALSTSRVQAFPLFDEGLSVEQVAERLGRAVSTTYGYLDAYIRQRKVTDACRWIARSELEQIEAVAEHAGTQRLKPIYEALHGRIGYERIRIALACLANRETQTTRDRRSTPAAVDYCDSYYSGGDL
jgi:ATP-dependent DNA helicase RecQ